MGWHTTEHTHRHAVLPAVLPRTRPARHRHPHRNAPAAQRLCTAHPQQLLQFGYSFVRGVAFYVCKAYTVVKGYLNVLSVGQIWLYGLFGCPFPFSLAKTHTTQKSCRRRSSFGRTVLQEYGIFRKRYAVFLLF